ncbi:MAG: sigma-70 family RNA polymerase sigma factor, partial [Defluviitaleaceae bacterium]|nr:sigma-70 family RNA polymerase sigma factor [Defluviitaleaceae bacterium]
RACLEKDNAYFAELVERYKNLAYSIILRMQNDREEANDLAQEVFIKIYKNLGKYYPDYKFSTWVMRITTNHVIDYNRSKKQAYAPIDEIAPDMPSRWEDSPDEQLVKKERSKKLADAVNGLPDMYKVPIVLYHQQGMSYQEISSAICEPLSKVKNRIFRGRKMLKDMLTLGREGELYEY